MFGRIFLARAYEAARPSLNWRSAVDYGERVVDGERFLFSYCRFCGERLAGASLRRYDRTPARLAGCVSASSITCTSAVRPSLPSTLGSGRRGDHGVGMLPQ